METSLHAQGKIDIYFLEIISKISYRGIMGHTDILWNYRCFIYREVLHQPKQTKDYIIYIKRKGIVY